ncbi:WD40-repeat-containing domain protein [Mycena leptocephala]|nr:WD40-repeat-containing domain protein [Mycena leptocephala]
MTSTSTDLSRTILTVKTSSQSGTLTRRGPGLTISQFVQVGGKLIESAVTGVFDRFKGPERCKSRIIEFLGDDDDWDKRQAALDELHSVLQHIAKALLTHARKSRSIDTQLLTFKILGSMIARYPGLRRCFRDHKDLQNKTEQDFETLWMREVQSCGEEWTFHRGLAAFLVSDSNLAKLVETAKPSELGLVKLEEGNLNKVPIEELLGWCRSGPDFNPLDFLRFDTSKESWNCRVSGVGQDLTQMKKVDETGAKVTDSSVDTSPSMSAARTAVDRFCAVVLDGIIQLKNRRRRALPSPVALREILDLLMSGDDTMAAFFPSSSARAPLVREEPSSPDSRPETPRRSDDASRPSGDARPNDGAPHSSDGAPPNLSVDASPGASAPADSSGDPMADSPHPSDDVPPSSSVGAVPPDADASHPSDGILPSSVVNGRHSSDSAPLDSSGEPNTDAPHPSDAAPPHSSVGVVDPEPDLGVDSRHTSDIAPPDSSGELNAEVTKIEGHNGMVTSVVFSPDGALVVSGDEDGGHDDWVESLAFSPDGMHVVSGSADKTVRIWDATTGAALVRMEGHTGRVMSVAFSPDGARVVSGSNDKTVRIWDAMTGAELGRIEGHTGWVTSVAFSPDSTRVVSGSNDETVRIWDAMTGAALVRMEGHTGWVTSVAFSPDSTRVVSGSNDETVRIWDAMTGAELGRIEGHTGWVTSVAFSPDSTRVVSGSRDETMRITDATTGATLGRMEGHSGWVQSAAFSPDGTHVVSGSADKTVRIWDAMTGALYASHRGEAQP